MCEQRLAEMGLDRLQRVEPGHRLLEDQPELRPAHLVHLLRRDADQLPARVADRAGDRRHLGQQAEHAPAEGRLAAAGLADEAKGLPRSDLERDAVDGADRIAGRAVPDAQVLDVEDRLLAGHGAPPSGSAAGGRRGCGSPGSEPRLGDLRLRRSPRADQRVDDVVEALAEQRETGHEGDDRHAREQARPPDPGARVVDRPLQVVAPLGRVGRLDAVAEEPEGRQGQDRVGRVERRQRGDVLDHVLKYVAADDRPPRRPERAGRLDVGLLANADHVVSDHAEVLRHVDGGDRDRGGHHALTELVGQQEGDHDRQQDVGEGEDARP